jgi:hypothetical protein
MYRIVSSANRDNLTSSSLFESFYLFLLPRKYSAILNKSGKNGHSCLIPDFRGNDFSLSPFSMALALVLSYISFIMLRYIPPIPSFLSFYFEKMMNFIKGFFCIYWDDHLIFSLDSVYVLYYIYFLICSTILVSLGWNQFKHGVWFLMCCWIQLQVFYWEVLCLFIKEIGI